MPNMIFMEIYIISLTAQKERFLLSAELEELIQPKATSRFLAAFQKIEYQMQKRPAS